MSAALIVTLAAGAFFIRTEGEQMRAVARREMALIAQNLASQVADECEKATLSLKLISGATPIRTAAARIASGTQTAADERLVAERLRALAGVYGYDEVQLLDSTGRQLFAVNGTEPTSTPAITGSLRAALQANEVVMSDLHHPTPSASPHLHFVAPLPLADGTPAAAAVVVTVDAGPLLYDRLAKWPRPDATGEALLLRRRVDGSVLISSPTRLSGDPPLGRALSATAASVEVQAFHSSDSLLEGVDYRGKRVLAHAVPVSGTPWVLLAKVDSSEALVAWRSQELLALIALALVETGIVGGAAYGWTRFAAAQRRREAERLAATLEVLRSEPSSPAELFLRLAREVMSATGSTACAVYRYHADADELSVDVHLSDGMSQPWPSLTSTKQRLAADSAGAWIEPIRTRSPVIIPADAERVLSTTGYPGHHLNIESFMALPIIVDGEPVAVVGLANAPDGYDERDAAEVAMVFEAAWHEVERLMLLEKLEARVEERTRELAEANEAKTKFLRTMSHELRTPLNSVIGFTQMMLHGHAGPVTEEQHRQLEMVNASGHHLLSLVNDLLDLSRIEAGAVEFGHEPIDVAALAAEVMDSVRALADAHGLALDLEVPDPPPSLVSDSKRVRQVLLNLLSNAVKYTARGRVRLAVRAEGHRTVSFEISDTGAGISEGDLGRIFDEFVQIGEHAQGNGTGLGLPIARHLACALGGSLTARSTVGAGSTFTFTLPQQ